MKFLIRVFLLFCSIIITNCIKAQEIQKPIFEKSFRIPFEGTEVYVEKVFEHKDILYFFINQNYLTKLSSHGSTENKPTNRILLLPYNISTKTLGQTMILDFPIIDKYSTIENVFFSKGILKIIWSEKDRESGNKRKLLRLINYNI
jgi:hypothetical protein